MRGFSHFKSEKEVKNEKSQKKQKRPPTGFGAWRFFTLQLSQNMIQQETLVSYLEKFKIVKTHRVLNTTFTII